MESSDNVEAPPNQLSSVDLGMSSIESTARFSKINESQYKSKKQVVLRKPKAPSTVFKSQQVLPLNQQSYVDHMRLIEINDGSEDQSQYGNFHLWFKTTIQQTVERVDT